jgi:hypothetical protein
MQLYALDAALPLGLGIDACSKYANCKCHDTRDELQNDAVTAAACQDFRNQGWDVTYNAAPHHQCTAQHTAVIDNCGKPLS